MNPPLPAGNPDAKSLQSVALPWWGCGIGPVRVRGACRQRQLVRSGVAPRRNAVQELIELELKGGEPGSDVIHDSAEHGGCRVDMGPPAPVLLLVVPEVPKMGLKWG